MKARKLLVGVTALVSSIACLVPQAHATEDTWRDQGQEVSGCPANFLYTASPSRQSLPFYPTNFHISLLSGDIARTVGSRPDVTARAIPFDALWLLGHISYNESTEKGADATIRVAEEDLSRCPDAMIHLAGWSLGADVVGAAFERIAHHQTSIDPEKVGSVVRLSASSRQSEGTVSWGTAVGGRGFNPPRNFGAYGNKVLEMCNHGDAVCDTVNIDPRLGKAITSVASNAPLRLKIDEAALEDLRQAAGESTEIIGPEEIKIFLAGWLTHGFSYFGDGKAYAIQYIEDHLQ